VDLAVGEGTALFAVLFDAKMLVVSDIDEAVIGLAPL
jgi:hypothetical protein